jgi:hypothetical protein
VGTAARHRLLRFLRWVPLAVVVAPVALLGLLYSVVLAATLFKWAIGSPGLLLAFAATIASVAVAVAVAWRRRRRRARAP